MSKDKIYYTLNSMDELVRGIGNYYTGDIQRWIDCNFSKKNYSGRSSQILKEVARKYNYNNNTFTNNIKSVCNKMAEEVLRELENLIRPDPFAAFLSILALFNCHLFLSYEILFWYKEKHSKSYSGADDSNIRQQLDVYFSYIEDQKKFNDLFYELQGHIASEKFALKLLLEICYDKSIEEKASKQPELDIEKIVEYSRALGKIIMIRDQVSRSIGCVKELNFDLEGEIYFKQDPLDFNSVGNKFLNWTISREYNNIPDKIIKKLNPICNNFVGFSITELIDLIDSLSNKYISQIGSIMIVPIDEWKNELEILTGKNELEINKLLKFISREPVENFDYIKNKQNKYLRNSVFFHEKIVIISLNLFLSSLMSLVNDVFYNNIELIEFNMELEKIHKEINEEFELECYELLKNNLTKNIIHNFTKFGDKPPYIESPGQIDILLYHQNTLYVIECKNYELKTDILSVANEIKRIQNKVFGKLEGKIEFVKENTGKFLPLIGRSVLESDDVKEIVGVVVTKNFSIGESCNGQFPIINCFSFIEWIKSRKRLG